MYLLALPWCRWRVRPRHVRVGCIDQVRQDLCSPQEIGSGERLLRRNIPAVSADLPAGVHAHCEQRERQKIDLYRHEQEGHEVECVMQSGIEEADDPYGFREYRDCRTLEPEFRVDAP